MGNLQFMMIASPDKHKDFINKINEWKYSIEGKYARGEQSPVVSEIKPYDVRIPDEIEARFVRDLGVRSLNARLNPAVKSRKAQFFQTLYRLFLKLTPWKTMEPAEGKKEYMLEPWYYVIPIGKLPRNKMQVETGGKREVL